MCYAEEKHPKNDSAIKMYYIASFIWTDLHTLFSKIYVSEIYVCFFFQFTNIYVFLNK